MKFLLLDATCAAGKEIQIQAVTGEARSKQLFSLHGSCKWSLLFFNVAWKNNKGL
jgi:hypothetical protein